ncbi:MAG: helix-turn-helix transcriptional regulator [Prevotellaceae bacterium]|nr:helix-turn-helix transcriptional regulator [Prevotellaceae bacterium]
MYYYDHKASGMRIQKLRKRAGLTQRQLAEAVNINISTLGKIERGLQGVSLDLLIEIASLFSSSLDYIVLGREFHEDFIKANLQSVIKTLKTLEKSI